MDRRAPALVALLLFVVLTGVSIAVGGSRPASDPGVLPWWIQAVAYVSAVVGAVLLLRGQDPAGRRTGALVLGVTVVLALIDALTAGQEGANIGAGLARLVGLVVLAAAITRLSLAVSAARRSTS
ncbi:hypothetical protein [Blastococcus atacamensis]|uniref:hypothetical protein n=1 Tax=Blastococcus atacamensis TaxID=2070508 RepID=UPI000CEC5D74|nr:hypothetical protein [Blastococcus atacamensis]